MVLSNMLPGITPDDGTNRGFTHTKLFSQLCGRFTSACMAISDFFYLIGGQFCKVLTFASYVALWLGTFHVAPFLVHIDHVIGMGSQEKVIGANASGVITTVAHKKPIGNWTISQLIGNTMRYVGMGFSVFYTAIERSIPEWGLSRTRPTPAFIGLTFDDFLPEALFKSFVSVTGFSSAGFRAIESLAPVNIGLTGRKMVFANETPTINLHIKTSFSLHYIPVSKRVQHAERRYYGKV